jgi:hypothetical protein
LRLCKIAGRCSNPANRRRRLFLKGRLSEGACLSAGGSMHVAHALLFQKSEYRDADAQDSASAGPFRKNRCFFMGF